MAIRPPGSRVVIRTLLPLLLLAVGCERAGEQSEFRVDFEKYTLANGLEVVLHEDRSDPIVAISACYHVGSSREVPGKRGLAHLVEHMMFQPSQNIRPGDRRQIGQAGGWQSGGTTEDVTIFLYMVPSNALELALWLEADRMGFLEPAITREALEREQQMVINENLQLLRTRPYASTGWILRELLYPETHPYYRSPGGSNRDVSLATLKDILEFHGRWYRPNNATLVVAGDFDAARTRQWIEKYFGELEPGPAPADPEPQPVALDSSQRAYRVDELASAPELDVWFPTVEQYHPDWYALNYLGELLSAAGNAPLRSVIVEERGLAPSVSAAQSEGEIAGRFEIRIRAFAGVDLNDVRAAIDESFRRFETESFTAEDLEGIRARTETGFFKDRLSNLWGKAERFAMLNEQAGSPGFLTRDLVNRTAVTRGDVLRVYEQYIRNKPYVMVSVVPTGGEDLVVAWSMPAAIVDEPVDRQATAAEPTVENIVVEPIPSSFDRTMRPPVGPDPGFTLPAIWKDTLSDGLRVLGIENHETPLVGLDLTLKGGQWLDGPDRVGSANLLANLMMEGTKDRTAAELRAAIAALGATLSVHTGRESISIQGICLASSFRKVAALLREILLEPRWDEAAFARIREQALEAIARDEADPPTVAQMVFDRLVYGPDHIFSIPTTGRAESVAAITLNDLKSYYERNISPSVAYITVVGDVSPNEALEAFRSLGKGWERKDVVFPEYPSPAPPGKAAVYFVDVPGLRQSVIRIGGPALAVTDPGYYPATVKNEALKGMLWAIADSGYAYPRSVGSSFNGLLQAGTFEAYARVRADATLESLRIFRELMSQWRNEVTAELFAATKNSLSKSALVDFESPVAKLSMLNDIAFYGFADDFIRQRGDFVRNVTEEEYQKLARTVVDPDRMVYVVVGDAASQLDRLRALGLGEPVLITISPG